MVIFQASVVLLLRPFGPSGAEGLDEDFETLPRLGEAVSC